MDPVASHVARQWALGFGAGWGGWVVDRRGDRGRDCRQERRGGELVGALESGRSMVEYCLLQLMLSPLSGDRVTLAVLHWDRSELRVHVSLDCLRWVLFEDRDAMRAAVNGVVRRARRAARGSHRQTSMFGLAELMGAVEGDGEALYCAPIVSLPGEVDGGPHFQLLMSELRMVRARWRRLSTSRLGRRLEALGRALQDELGAERIRTRMRVERRHGFSPPLSWHAGSWHHAIPWSVEPHEQRKLDAETERIYGLVELAIPADHVPIVVASMAELNGMARRAIELLRDALSQRAVEVLVVPRSGRSKLDFTELVQRIRADLKR